jgi:hypothetical protein
MFDLEARIREWRKRLTGRLGNDVIDELESHLREEMHRAALMGRPLEPAWTDAVARLGSPDGLASEFAKVPESRPLRSIAAWCVFALYLLVAAGFIFPLLAKLNERESTALLVAHVAATTFGYMTVFPFAVLSSLLAISRLWGGATPERIAGLRSLGRFFLGIAFVQCLIGFVLGSAWSRDRFGVFWSNDAAEIGAVAMIVWTLALAIRFCGTSTPSLVDVALGIACNLVMGMSWFGAAYVKSFGWLAADFAKQRAVPSGLLGFMVAWFAVHGLLMILAIVPLPHRDAEPLESSR